MDYAKYFVETPKKQSQPLCDQWLLRVTLVIIAMGVIMVASASISIAQEKMNDAFYFTQRHLLFLGIGLIMSLIVLKVPVIRWYRLSPLTLLITFILLVFVFVPGIGQSKPINGSLRWIPIGSYNLQVSELAKLFVMSYLAGYLVRHAEDARSSLSGFIRPLTVVFIICAMLVAQPDFGTAVVIMISAMILMFLGGVRSSSFLIVSLAMLALFVVLVYAVNYRLERFTSFRDPWAHSTNTGYQLVNSFMAFGLGGFSGVGIGAGLQKTGYLPEPHTDFLYAVIGEELGLIGTTLVILLFVVLVTRSFAIGQRALVARLNFHGYFAYGIGIWIGLQAFINMGVNLGLLPTTGLTLPLMSYGGSSLITTMMAIAILLRIDYETRTKPHSLRPRFRQA